ncbi:hypothetical protein SLEP1_g12925 [Rubroshorea leprosula]|uniref:Uncharacterized protein n=1 Tax=Rubroshorea leprosula TaxID=152421 RepID=A0AAV5IN93_9ROSI|nr:hypothetical protein SLEP1_g12925 [Rubroshorea leprosula]
MYADNTCPDVLDLINSHTPCGKLFILLSMFSSNHKTHRTYKDYNLPGDQNFLSLSVLGQDLRCYIHRVPK